MTMTPRSFPMAMVKINILWSNFLVKHKVCHGHFYGHGHGHGQSYEHLYNNTTHKTRSLPYGLWRSPGVLISFSVTLVILKFKPFDHYTLTREEGLVVKKSWIPDLLIRSPNDFSHNDFVC